MGSPFSPSDLGRRITRTKYLHGLAGQVLMKRGQKKHRPGEGGALTNFRELLLLLALLALLLLLKLLEFPLGILADWRRWGCQACCGDHSQPGRRQARVHKRIGILPGRKRLRACREGEAGACHPCILLVCEPCGTEKLTERQNGLPVGAESRKRVILSPMTGVIISSPES